METPEGHPCPQGLERRSHYGCIMLIKKIQYHKVICQVVFKQGEKAGFRTKENPWKWLRFPGV